MLVMFTDTDTDMTPQLAEQYGYKLISMPYVIDGVTVRPYEDFDEFDFHAFYDKLRAGTLPQTCAISPDDYVRYFEPYYKNGDDILYVHFSGAMSGTFNAMKLAVDSLAHSYPDTHFYTIDTKGITTLSYTIVREIGDMYKRGATVEQMLAWAETEVDKFAIYFYADDLKFFRRSGRVTNLAATMGNLFGVHPVLNMGSDGMMHTHSKANGRVKTLKRIVSYVEELQDDIRSHRVCIGHTDCLPIAELLASLLREKFGDDLDIEIEVVNPTAGSHCGPDAVGVCFHAIHR